MRSQTALFCLRLSIILALSADGLKLCHTLSNTYQDKERTRLAYEHYERYFALGGSDASLRATYDSLLVYKDQILGT